MQMETNRLGSINVIGSRELSFEQGLPGFEEYRDFVLLDLEIDLPIKLLQTASDPDISLLVGNPFHFYPDYEWELPSSVQQELQITEKTPVEIWSVIILPANAADATINLIAPIVVNGDKGIGKQIILHNSPYNNRHPLIAKTEGQPSQGQVD